MSVSKPLKRAALSLTVSCLQTCYEYPVATQSASCSLMSFLGNLTSQRLTSEPINRSTLLAYAAFGLLFGKTVPTYFHKLLDILVPGTSSWDGVKRIILDAGVFCPMFLFLKLYFLSMMEGDDHEKSKKTAMIQMKKILREYYRWMSIARFIRTSSESEMFQVMFDCAFDFFWAIKLSELRANE